jgi:ribose 5-phosphate isomerase B
MEKFKLAIASDLSGYPLKKAVVAHLKENYADKIEVIDFGIASEDKPKPYFEQAPKVAKSVQSGEAEKGILICGTGQGMAITANKFKGIYAAVVDSVFSAERSKIINNANIITMGGWITAPFLGTQIVDAWLSMAFTQKMEFKKDFLTNAFKEVQMLEDEIYG